MGNIANKRGSVRQAPPDVYMGFASSDGNPEAMDEVITLFGRFTLYAVGTILLAAIAVIFSAVGCIPDISD
jgi:hypothetical protein